MNLFDIQLTAAITLFAGTFFCGCLPLFLFRICNSTGRGESRFVAFLVYFGGGVLMATAMLHLLPQAKKEMSAHNGNIVNPNISNLTDTEKNIEEGHDPSHQHEHGFAIPELIMLGGFFATYLVDVLLYAILQRQKSNPECKERSIHTKFCSCSQRNIECSRIFKPDHRPQRVERKKRSATWAGQTTEQTSRQFSSDHRNQPDILRSSIISRQVPNYGSLLISARHEPPGLPVRIDGVPLVNRQVSVPPQLSEIPEISAVSGNHQVGSTTPITTILTVAALSFHSVFEGVAIGFQKTGMGIWTTLLAVAIHKFVIAFVVGVEAFADGVMTCFMIVCVFIFSIMTPLGVTLTMFLGTAGQKISTSSIGIVNLIATGTLIYITFYEIFPRKNNFSSSHQLRFWGMIFGFMLMAAIEYASTLIG